MKKLTTKERLTNANEEIRSHTFLRSQFTLQDAITCADKVHVGIETKSSLRSGDKQYHFKINKGSARETFKNANVLSQRPFRVQEDENTFIEGPLSEAFKGSDLFKFGIKSYLQKIWFNDTNGSRIALFERWYSQDECLRFPDYDGRFTPTTRMNLWIYTH
jgi:hypothetical protein